MLVDAGGVDDFADRSIRIVNVSGREIGIARWGERFFAIRNHCPDQGGPLCTGPLRAMLRGGPGDIVIADGTPVIACPWHHREFELDRGKEVRGITKAVVYPTSVSNGRVFIEIVV